MTLIRRNNDLRVIVVTVGFIIFISWIKIFRTTERIMGSEIILNNPQNNIIDSMDKVIKNKILDAEIEDMNKKIVPGFGEKGTGVFLTGSEKELGDKIMEKEAINIVASDKISYTRSIPDNRPKECTLLQYPNDLPNASVVIIFFNEAWSILLRTVHSVINRTPSYLLHEVIMVDDYSDRVEMKARLSRYVKLNFDGRKVKLLRASRRLGLIRARLAGAKAATGKVLIFMDSHCEVNTGWVEPLLMRIQKKRKTAVVPVIEIIDDGSLQYFSYESTDFQVGSFSWSGDFVWIDIPKREYDRRESEIDPTRSATMAGGLFAMERKYFWELGGYDGGMDVWGGENLELSFRIWMCGGSLETIPCSRVGHIFRNFFPYKTLKDRDTYGINTVRMAEVWMDNYKRFFYLYRPDLKTVNYGDISKRKKLRQKLKCQDFKWYLANVTPEKFILDEHSIAYGRVMNIQVGYCLDNFQNNEEYPYDLGLYPCHKRLEMSQFFSFSIQEQLRREKGCASANDRTNEISKVKMTPCSRNEHLKVWKIEKNGPIIHKVSKRCLDPLNVKNSTKVWVAPCDGSQRQKWKFLDYNIEVS